ncbi:MAG: T9SS type A sorting domain-containing protein [Bacteroidota bacterium]
MKLIYLFFIALLYCPFSLKAQVAPIIEWRTNVGDSDIEYLPSIQQTTDNGYIAAGGGLGYTKCKVVKLYPNGNIEWKKYYGGNRTSSYSVQQTRDSGFIVGGAAKANNNPDDYDAWVLKLNAAGDSLLGKNFGGTQYDYILSIQQTPDGGYIFCGASKSSDRDLTQNHGGFDCWVVKLDSTYAIEWQKSLGGSKYEEARCIKQTTDGGYIFVGHTNSNDGDVVGYHVSNVDDYDAWVVKLNMSGNIEWQKCLGGTGAENAYCIRQTNDGGYIVAVTSNSINGDVTGNHGDTDYWIVKLAPDGSIIRQKSLGGSGQDNVLCIRQTSDEGYIIAGVSTSLDGDVSSNRNALGDSWIVKTDTLVNIEWQKNVGGTQGDASNDIQQTSDGWYVTAIDSYSNDGDLGPNDGSIDSWIVKLGPFPVPLLLTSFTAQKLNRSVLLNWQTQTEINTKHFVVEKSSNTIDFKTLNTIAASGNSSTTKNYSCTDTYPFYGINYYRLKQVDKDGSFVYSKTVAVNFNQKGSMIYPNPASSSITIVAVGNIKSISIIDAEGKTVQQLKPSLDNQYDISRLPKGLYVVKLLSNQGEEVLQLHKN